MKLFLFYGPDGFQELNPAIHSYSSRRSSLTRSYAKSFRSQPSNPLWGNRFYPGYEGSYPFLLKTIL
jgi:hypothetical protein